MACSSGANQTTAQTSAKAAEESIAEVIAPAVFKEKLQEKTNALLIDIRTPGEIANGHIPNASFIDFNGGKFEEEIGALDKEQPIFLYCASGGRSGRALKMMKKLGFKEIYDLDGGMRDWTSEGMEVVKP